MNTIKHLRARDISGTPVTIVPIPFAEGIRGMNSTAAASGYLKKQGLVRALRGLGCEVEETSAVRSQDVAEMARGVRARVARALGRGERCIAVGGSHTVALGSIGGALEVHGKDLGVIWIDAHGDLNTPETSPTGHFRGMVLSALMGLGAPLLTDLVPVKLPSRNLLHIGLKDADLPELALIQKRSLDVVTAAHVAADGLRMCAKRIERLARCVKRVWVSWDVDSVDERDAPASSMATPGALTYREITTIMRHIGNTCDVVGLDIVEFAPRRDVRGKTARLASELAASALGAVHNWYTAEYLRENGKGA